MTKNLKKVIKRAQLGEKSALLLLCEDNAEHILYLCVKMMGNLQDGEDAAQEVFLKMTKNILVLKESSAFSAWMNTIIMNTCTTMKKNANKESGDVSIDNFEDFIETEDKEFLPCAYVEEKEKRDFLLESINNLPEHYKSVVLMFYYEEMSQKNIAEVLGISASSVDHILRRAKAKIKKDLVTSTNNSISKEYIAMGASVPVLTQALKYESSSMMTPSAIEKVGIMIQQAVVAITAGQPAAGGILQTKTLVGAIVTVVVAIVLILAVQDVSSKENLVGIAKYNPSITSFASDTSSFPPKEESVGVKEELDKPEKDSITSAERNSENTDRGSSTKNSQTTNPSESGNNVVQENKVTISLLGKISLKGVGDKLILLQNINLQGMNVSLCHGNGDEVSRTKTKKDGTYAFESVSIVPNQEYYLKISLTGSNGYVFAEESEKGILPVFLNDAKEQNVSDIYLKNQEPVSAVLLFYNEAGERSSVNPIRGTISVKGVSNMDIRWAIIDEVSSEIVRQGTGDNLTAEDFAVPMESGMKRYKVVVQVQNDFGNSTTVEEKIILTK